MFLFAQHSSKEQSDLSERVEFLLCVVHLGISHLKTLKRLSNSATLIEIKTYLQLHKCFKISMFKAINYFWRLVMKSPFDDIYIYIGVLQYFAVYRLLKTNSL